MKKFVAECSPIPRGYGIAYRETHRLGAIAYPIPLHLVVMAWHHFYSWLILAGWIWKTKQEVLCDTCFENGRKSSERANNLRLISRIQVTEETLDRLLKLRYEPTQEHSDTQAGE